MDALLHGGSAFASTEVIGEDDMLEIFVAFGIIGYGVRIAWGKE